MRNLILQTLADIERRENVRILLAVESGSRAWGFASPDSDYDVRFLYVRPWADYLRLEGRRDVLELPISDLLDVNGWDLDKTLKLLHGSNPTLFEWFSSPIVYRSSPFAERFLPFMQAYYSTKKSLWHYLRMAERHYQEFLRDRDLVKAKKYFYVLRPILACRWILRRGTPPPMRFSDLAAAELDPAQKPAVDELLDLKIHAPEVRQIPRVETLNVYLEESLSEIKARIDALPDAPAPEWTELNALFLSEIAPAG